MLNYIIDVAKWLKSLYMKFQTDFVSMQDVLQINVQIISIYINVNYNYTSSAGSPDYAIAFYVGDCLLLVSIAVTMLMNLGVSGRIYKRLYLI